MGDQLTDLLMALMPSPDLEEEMTAMDDLVAELRAKLTIDDLRSIEAALEARDFDHELASYDSGRKKAINDDGKAALRWQLKNLLCDACESGSLFSTLEKMRSHPSDEGQASQIPINVDEGEAHQICSNSDGKDSLRWKMKNALRNGCESQRLFRSLAISTLRDVKRIQPSSPDAQHGDMRAAKQSLALEDGESTRALQN